MAALDLALPLDEHGQHAYLSTACLHEAIADTYARARELHAYCAGERRLDGQPKDGGPARCKWCHTPCTCPGHANDPVGE